MSGEPSGPNEGANKGFKVVDRRQAREEESAAAPAQASSSHADAPASSTAAEVPEAIDFSTFVLSLASSALMHLGELPPEPGEPHPAVSLPLAKHTIDLLGMLAEKTKGNLSSDEQRLLEHLLYDLRLKYVSRKKG